VSSEPPLTTTTYAVLGLLAVKPWTTYELIQQMEKSLWRIWPRATSRLYEEPKKLVAHGLAQATRESVGKRTRTAYSITPKGRRALRRWLGEPAGGPVVEDEQLLKLFFAEHGTKADALARLAEARAWAAARAAEDLALSRAYVAGEGGFPERAAVLEITGRFISDFARMVGEWAEWATAKVEAWPADVRAVEPDLTYFADYVRRAESDSGGSPA
jgi:DNA-binding PadR family transcriptional regulator